LGRESNQGKIVGTSNKIIENGKKTIKSIKGKSRGKKNVEEFVFLSLAAWTSANIEGREIKATGRRGKKGTH